MHAELLTDRAKGKEYFDELKAKYPDDMLSWQSRLLLGEIDSIPASASLPKAKQEASTKADMPTTVALLRNYPNPFNPATTFKFDLPEPSIVSLVVYDVLGRKVAELLNASRDAGHHSVTWNAKDVASGVYFARFTVTDAIGNAKLSKVNKLLLAK